MTLFDWPEHLVGIGQRASTTTSPQVLLFMNSPLAAPRPKALRGVLSPVSRVGECDQAGYKLALGRPAAESETRLAVDFLARQRSTHSASGDPDPARRR